MKYITFDIETGPLPLGQLESVMPEFEAPKNYKDPAKIDAAIAEKRHKWVEQAALSAATGQVLLIGFSIHDQDGVGYIMQGEYSEKEVLIQWWNMLEDNPAATFVGYNCRKFDLPFLIRRSLILGIPVPEQVRNPRQWGGMVDLMECWQLGDRQESTGGMDGLAKAFGLEGKNGSGAEFAQKFRSDDPAEREEAIAYAVNDVELTEELGRRMGIIPVCDGAGRLKEAV